MEYYKLGKLVASFGLKGELILSHTLGKKSALKGLQAIFTEEKQQSFLPWFIESVRVKNDTEVYLKLETIDSKEAAMRLTRREVWIPEAEFKMHAANTAPISLLGYTIFNGEQELAPILEIIEQPHQVLCRIEMQGREVLIPLHQETLGRIDHEQKTVITTLPEGLLEIYLE